ncbi:MAG: glutamate racemase [Bacteroidales bacterium]
MKAPIGIFDSGYGGLTILNSIRKVIPEYDYIYLGDNARTPYGNRSFEIVYQFTLEAVKYLFSQGCELVILACNTASAKALRSIQQNDLPLLDGNKRVLGVLRPTVEALGEISQTGNIGIFGTSGTIQSQSYDIEIAKLYPNFKTYSHACPMWVPLVENNEGENNGADYFIEKDIESLFNKCSYIDSIILGCTHYPILINKISKYTPKDVIIITQGDIVAKSLKNYLNRHPEIETKCSKGFDCRYLTTESVTKFQESASLFLNTEINAEQIIL